MITNPSFGLGCSPGLTKLRFAFSDLSWGGEWASLEIFGEWFAITGIGKHSPFAVFELRSQCGTWILYRASGQSLCVVPGATVELSGNSPGLTRLRFIFSDLSWGSGWSSLEIGGEWFIITGIVKDHRPSEAFELRIRGGTWVLYHVFGKSLNRVPGSKVELV